jgi:hypothetical protein
MSHPLQTTHVPSILVIQKLARALKTIMASLMGELETR